MKKVAAFLMLAFLLLPYPAFAEDLTKTIKIEISIKNDSFSEISKTIVYSHPPDLGLQQGPFIAKVISVDGSLFGEFNIWDPRIQMGDEIVMYENGTVGRIEGKVVRTDEARFSVMLPFHREIKVLEIYDKESGEKMLSVELASLIGEFCETHKEDPDCGGAVTQMNYLLIIALIFLVVVIILFFSVKKLKGPKAGKKR
ncbi:MAG: hypothetical protein QW761_01740 [Candidatus Aenigmatarchaeota archaeon]